MHLGNGPARDVLQLRSSRFLERSCQRKFLLPEGIVDEPSEFTKCEVGMLHQQVQNSFKLLEHLCREGGIELCLVVDESQQQLRPRHDQPVEWIIIAIK